MDQCVQNRTKTPATLHFSRFSCRAALLASTALLAAAAATAPVNAQTNWLGTNSSTWSEADNWSAGVPGAASNAVINTTSPNAPWIAIGTVAIVGGKLDVGQSATARLDVAGGGRLTTGYSAIGTLAGANGRVTVSGTNAQWTNSGTLYVGDYGAGILNVNTGGSATTASLTIGLQAHSTGTVGVGGGTLTTTSGLFVGNAGTGVMIVQLGGAVTSQYSTLGVAVGSIGQVTVSGTNPIGGAASKWTITGDGTNGLSVGGAGAGTLTISTGGAVTSNFARIAAEGTSISSAKVTDSNSLWTTGSTLDVGYKGNGTLRIENAGKVTSTAGSLGTEATGARGSVTVTGFQSRWDMTAGLIVGGLGNGTLQVEGGGTVKADGFVIIGNRDSSTSTATVTGAFATLQTSGDLVVGNFGNGSLRLEARGEASGTTGIIGKEANSSGSVTVTGNASRLTNIGGFYVGGGGNGTLLIEQNGRVTAGTFSIIGNAATSTTSSATVNRGIWQTTGDFIVGNFGTGSLRVEGGGFVTNVAAYIAKEAATARGDATVTGAGSRWNSTGGLIVGSVGSGTLSVEAGGAVKADGYVIVANRQSSTSTTTVTGTDSTLTSGGDVIVGNFGNGTLRVETSGAVSSTGNSLIANFDNSIGSATLNSATWTSSGDFVVGHLGNGTLRVENGSVVTAVNGYIAKEGEAARGDATVTGTGSRWTNSGVLLVGGMGNGTLLVDAGGVVTAGGYVVIGSRASSTSSATVRGADSTLSGVSEFTVGNFGNGTLLVEAGGAVSSTGVAIIGKFARSTGSATLNNGTWTATGDVTVGQFGTGTLRVEAGGILSNVNGAIALEGERVRGDATVTGTGSRWNSSGWLIVGGVGNGSLRVEDRGVVSAGDFAMIGNRDTSNSSITVTGTGSTFSSGDLTVGNFGIGNLRVEAGGTVTTSGTALIGRQAGSSGTATITGANATWVVTGPGLVVGLDGNGTLAIADGGAVTSTESALGWTGGTTGTATLTDAGTSWTVLGALTIGRQGRGDVVVRNGAHFMSGASTIADQGTSTSTVLVSGTGSSWDVGSDLSVGRLGNGTLRVDWTGRVGVAGHAIIGAQTGGVGAVTVNGAESTMTVGGQTVVGYLAGSTGSLAIEDGGALTTAGSVEIGYVAGATGSASVTGLGSTWNANGIALVIGSAGSGQLTVAGRGSVASRATTLGADSGSTGTATVTGSGSLWTVTGAIGGGFTVGRNGSGEVKVEAGAQLATPNTDIGLYGGSGRVTVTGAGSTWANSGALTVGGQGTGVVTVANGGALSTASMTLAQAVGSNGTLIVGAAAAEAAVGAGQVTATSVAFGAGTGTIVFNHTSTLGMTFGAAISGAGTINQIAGKTILTGTSTNVGATNVNGGTLQVDGAMGAATVTVASGARLGGSGSIGGPVTIANGGTIAPGSSPGVLTVGTLTLNSGSSLDFELGAVTGVNDRIDVMGALTLDGTLNITDAGGFGAGVYRLINYGGPLTNNGLVLGTLPPGVTPADLIIQTSVANQVNLISGYGAVLQFWDGGAATNFRNGVIDGGSGRWTATSPNWTTADGLFNGPMRPQPGFAIFQATPGTVTVDISAGEIAVTGMQFAVDGYRITGDQIVLAGSGGTSIIRVGDGTAAGAGYTATIDSALEGASRLVKTDLGTLVLTGINTYDGGTTITSGVLQIGSGGTTGSILGDVLNNATLRFARSDATTFGGAISGSGAAQVASGDVTLTANNTYSGGTTIATGATLQLGNGGTTGSIVGDVTNNGLLRFQRSDTVTFGGAISGSGAVDISSGTVIVTGANNYSGGTSITFGATLQIGNGGTTGSITGNVVNEGTLAFARTDATLFDGVISGAGGMAVQSGTVGLTNTNTYMGGTTIASGATLQIGNGGTTGSIEGNVANNGTLRFARSDATTFGYVISGTGGVAVQSGTLSLTNVNTYTGRTTIAAGATLRFANLDSVVGGSIVGDVVNNGLMQFQRNGTLTLAGVISGTGALQVQTGTVALTGANTYSGGTTVANGATLQLGNGGISGSIAGNVANDGTLRFQRSDATTYGGEISGFGGVAVQSGAVTFTNGHSYRGGTTIASGATLQLGNGGTTGSVSGNIANNGTLIFNQSGETSNGSVFTGNGLIRQVGSGATMLTANSSAFAGTTQVEAGALIIEGRLGGTVNVMAGTLVQGTGTLGNVTLAGTIAPGNSIGTLNVGSITFQAGSIYQVEVNAAGRSDKIVASGTATLTGGSVKVLAGTGNYQPTTTYTILTAAGGRTGTFAGVTSNLAFLNPELTYDPTNVYLTLSRNDVTFGSIGGTFNQRQAGAGTESLGMGNPLWNAVVQLSAPMARAAFDQLSGEVHASTKTALYEDSRLVRDGALSRLRSAFGGGAVAAGPSTAQVAAVDDGSCSTEVCQAVPPTQSGIAAWAQGFGSWGYTSGNGNAAGLSRSTGGVLVGVDAAVFEVARLGLFGGYSHTNFNVADRQSSGGSDNIHLGAYGGAQWGPIGVRAGLAYTWHNLSTSRSVAFAGFADSLRATYGAGTFQLFGEAGYRFDVGPATFEPFANIAWMSLTTKGFSETGGAAALTSAGLTTNVTTTTVGLRAGSAFTIAGLGGNARGTVGWQHAFTDTTPWAALQLTGGTPFTAAGVPIAQDTALLELGIELALSARASLGLAYTGQFAAGAQDQSVRGNFTFKF